jgi:hypothetical protein
MPTYTPAAAPANAPLASPAFTGTPTAPTQAPLNNSTRVATTAYADLAVGVEKTRALAAEAAIAAAGSVTGSKASGAALTSLLTVLAAQGIIVDNTTT